VIPSPWGDDPLLAIEHDDLFRRRPVDPGEQAVEIPGIDGGLHMAGMAAVRIVQAATEGDDPVVGNPREDRLRKNQAAPGIALVLAKIGPVGNIDLGQRPRCIEAEAPGRIGDTQALRLRDGIEQGLELGMASAAGKAEKRG
jgi:hypothetical protein